MIFCKEEAMPNITNAAAMSPFMTACEAAGLRFTVSDLAEMQESSEWPEHPSGLCVHVPGGCVIVRMRNGAPFATAAFAENDMRWEDGEMIEDTFSIHKMPGVIDMNVVRVQKPAKIWQNGQPVWFLSKGRSFLARAVVEDGKLLGGWCGDTFEKRVPTTARNRGLWGEVKFGNVQGWASLWSKGERRADTYWGLPNRVMREECTIRGWYETNAGKILLPGGSLARCLDPKHNIVTKARREGLQEPREWTYRQIEDVAAVEVLMRGLRASEAFCRWFAIEWEDGRRATWEHAAAFEGFVKDFSS